VIRALSSAKALVVIFFFFHCSSLFGRCSIVMPMLVKSWSWQKPGPCARCAFRFDVTHVLRMSNITSHGKAIESLFIVLQGKGHTVAHHVYPSSHALHPSSRHHLATDSLFLISHPRSGLVAEHIARPYGSSIHATCRFQELIKGSRGKKGQGHDVPMRMNFSPSGPIVSELTPTGEDARTSSAPAGEFPRSRLLVVTGASARR